MTTRSKTATRTSEGDVNKAFAKPVDVKGAARTADAAENQIHLGILFAHVALGSACSLVKGPRLVANAALLFSNTSVLSMFASITSTFSCLRVIKGRFR